MKNKNNPFILLACFLGGCCFSVMASDEVAHKDVAEVMPEENQYANDIFDRTGEIPAKELISRYKKFANNYQKYQPQAEELKLFNRLDGFELVVFFGLWCHDSQREIPRLLKLIDKSNTYFKSVKLIALDTDKVLSEKFSSKYEVSSTPTIYVVDNRQVIAKIVERPKISWGFDLVEQIFKSGSEKNIQSQPEPKSQTRK